MTSNEGCGNKIGPYDCCTIVEGDCLDVMAEMSYDMIPLVITDPPYGIDYVSAGGPRATDPNIKQRTRITGDSMIDPQWFAAIYPLLKSSGAMYVFTCFKSYSEFEAAIKQAGFVMKTTLVWDKGNCGMGDLKGDYGNQTELVMFGTKGRHLLNGRRDRNILPYQRPSDAHRLHPTQKPVSLIKYLIRKSSYKGDLIVDPFAGSGSTFVAAKELGRHYFGCDIDSECVAMTEKRLSTVQLAMEL